MKLYEITSVMRALMDTLSDAPLNSAEGKPLHAEAQAEHEAAQAAFESTSDDMRTKIRAMVSYALELRTVREAREATMDSIARNVLDKMNAANKRDASKEDWLLSTVQNCMQAVGIPMPVQFDEFRLNLQKNPQIAEIIDEAAIPAEYKTITTPEPVTKIDKKRLNEDAREGLVIAGARLSMPTYRLTIL